MPSYADWESVLSVLPSLKKKIINYEHLPESFQILFECRDTLTVHLTAGHGQLLLVAVQDTLQQ